MRRPVSGEFRRRIQPQLAPLLPLVALLALEHLLDLALEVLLNLLHGGAVVGFTRLRSR
jgi:hypothetical protein